MEFVVNNSRLLKLHLLNTLQYVSTFEWHCVFCRKVTKKMQFVLLL